MRYGRRGDEGVFWTTSVLSSIVSLTFFINILHSLWVGDGSTAGHFFVGWIIYGVIAMLSYLIGQATHYTFYLLGVIVGIVLMFVMFT